MKSVFVFAIFVIIAVAHAEDNLLKEKIDLVTKECAKKTNFSEEGIAKLKAHDLTETENVKCFKKCFLEDFGIVTDKGLDTEKIISLAKNFNKDEAKTKENIERCLPLYKADSFDCDAAWELHKCFKQQE